MIPAFGFRFEVGSIVWFGRGRRFYEVKWRGWLVQGPPGGRYRTDVYWLGGPLYECYFGDELYPIGRHPF